MVITYNVLLRPTRTVVPQPSDTVNVSQRTSTPRVSIALGRFQKTLFPGSENKKIKKTRLVAAGLRADKYAPVLDTTERTAEIRLQPSKSRIRLCR